MMANFETDLGDGFALDPHDTAPAPSRRLSRCLYRELLRRENEDDTLGPVQHVPPSNTKGLRPHPPSP